MDFSFTSEQQGLADSVQRFCQKEYEFDSYRRLSLSDDSFSREHWATFAKLGWLGAGLSEEAGGFGGSAIENAIIAEQFGRALVLEPFLSTAVLSLQTLAALPPATNVAPLIEHIVSGEALVALAHSEPAARGDARFVETAATRSGNGWRLDGHKSFVLGAASADHLLVSATSREGVGLFRVSPSAPGLRIRPYRTLSNIRVGDIWLDDVHVEGNDVLAAPGLALDPIEKAVDHATTVAGAEALGAMDAALWMTRDYLKTRKQFGTTLNNFQALQHRMADMLIELELSRSIVYQALAALDAPAAERRRAVSAMKAIISSAGMWVGRNAIQLHGGIGMTEEYAIGHYYRRLFVIASLFGDEDHHLQRVADAKLPMWSDALLA